MECNILLFPKFNKNITAYIQLPFIIIIFFIVFIAEVTDSLTDAEKVRCKHKWVLYSQTNSLNDEGIVC